MARQQTTGQRTSTLQWIVVSGTAALGLLLIVAYFSSLSTAGEREHVSACLALAPEPLAGAAKPFKLPDLHGKQRSLAEQRGKVVLLNFWATWCPPCVEELPSMVRLRQQLDPDDFTMVTVSVDDSAAVVQRFLTRHRAIIGDLPVLIDPSKKTPTAYGTLKFPETYLIDRTGNLRYRFVNKRDWGTAAAAACIRSLM